MKLAARRSLSVGVTSSHFLLGTIEFAHGSVALILKMELRKPICTQARFAPPSPLRIVTEVPAQQRFA
jgi:hypothetical protein